MEVALVLGGTLVAQVLLQTEFCCFAPPLIFGAAVAASALRSRGSSSASFGSATASMAGTGGAQRPGAIGCFDFFGFFVLFLIIFLFLFFLFGFVDFFRLFFGARRGRAVGGPFKGLV